MKFSCEKYILHEAIAACSRVAPNHASMEILKGLMINAENDTVLITGSNIDITITAGVEANILEKGICIIEAKMFLDIVRKLPNELITIELCKRNLLKISCSMSKFEISAMEPENYPNIPAFKVLGNIRLSQAKLKRQINQTVFSASENETKAIHMGVFFDIEDDALTLVAIDGHRLALCKELIKKEEIQIDNTIGFVVPANTLKEIEKILSDQPDIYADISIGSKNIIFNMGQFTVISRLLEGEFLKYKNAIPSACAYSFICNTRELSASIERVSLLINEKLKNPIRMLFEYDSVTIKCTTNMGKAQDICGCSGGEPIEIGFNHKYVIDALKHIENENVKIKVGGSLMPCLFVPEYDDGSLFMVLPVRLQTE